ncbi:unnamed protein product [Acanthoscelides obtectus]|uniref:Uncharacterized protein n=1 Tax=Acanthoscelides obtectus TaxID=200917 RepID=A0A9P0KEC9_ACAOB|nr:unnamed protein product [Acanthoscelides obtectus]CAK1635532.1 hypothetical protein AOBTE_LOCUS9337 [Acanthoscelides obtectus]
MEYWTVQSYIYCVTTCGAWDSRQASKRLSQDGQSHHSFGKVLKRILVHVLALHEFLAVIDDIVLDHRN